MTAREAAGPPSSADLDAARLLLARMGLSARDLLDNAPARRPVPTFAVYVPVVAAAVGDGTRRVYGSYWNRILDQWADRRLDEPTPSEIKQLVEHVRHHVVARRNGRGGRCAGERLVAALRCLYRHAEDDGLIGPAENPARKVAKPRRLPSTRRAVPDSRLAEVNQVAATTGNDPALDTLLVRLHLETACRRGGALALRPQDLDPTQCLVFLREKGETVRWQPVSPTLMAHLQHHAVERRAPADRQLLRYADGRPITTRRYDHLWTRIGRPAPLGGDSAGEHPLAAAHHPDLGRAQLRLRSGPRLRRTHRRRRGRRRDGDLCARGRARVATALSAMTAEAHPLAS